MSASSFDLLDSDQPIPLGPGATHATRPEAPAVQSAVELQPAVPPACSEAQPAVEMPSLAPPPAAVVAGPEVVPAMAFTTPAVVNPAPPPVANRPPADPPAQPDCHPMAALRGFRLEPILVEPTYSWRRDVGRFLVQFALVMAFVYALIVAFVLLIAHARGSAA